MDTTDLLDFDCEDMVRIGTPPIKQTLLSACDRGTYRDGGDGDETFPSEEATTQAEEELREARQATALVLGCHGISSPCWQLRFILSEESYPCLPERSSVLP